MATGFSFGAKTTAPAFGTSFGAPTQTVAPTFGLNTSTNQPSTGFQFGASNPTSTAPSLFGSTAPTFGSTAPTFGSTAPSFGTATASFGQPTASVAPTFGTTTAATTSLFGTPSTATSLFGTNTTTPSLSFGVSSGGGLSFGTPATTAGLSFGAPTASVAPLSFGTSSAPTTSLLGTSTAAPTLGLSFGTGTTTTSSLFGTTTTTSGLGGFGLGGVSSAGTTLTFPTVTTASASVGLGGIATQAKTTPVATQKEIPPKDQPLPNEIQQTVDQFKEHVKQQKLYSSDIARCSVREFRKVEQEVEMLSSLIKEVESQLLKNMALAEKLKYDTAKSHQHVEMAQRTQDTPSGLQYENTAPMRFFLELTDKFEKEMVALKIQIESAEKFVRNSKEPTALSAQDLSLGLRRLHEAFVALAGRLQAIHSQVETQKESYVQLRKKVYNDHRNPFNSLKQQSFVADVSEVKTFSPPKIASGPTPFSNLVPNFGQEQPPPQNPPAYPGTSFGNLSFNPQPSNTSLMPSFGQTSVLDSSFQLQKPPTGCKRGKQ